MRYSVVINVAAQPREATLRAEVYDIVRQIPRGWVLTYGRIAALCGWPNHSRLVGRIMRTAPDADLPCHRVVNSVGRTAPDWIHHRPLLEAEGVRFLSNGHVDMQRHLWEPFDISTLSPSIPPQN